MEDSILLEKYIISWKNETEIGFISEIYHYIKNQHGGMVQTPIGILMGYQDPHPKYWNIKIILRSDIDYDSKRNRITVLAKSAYKNKIKHYWDIFISNLKSNLPIDPNLQDEIIKLLSNRKITEEPMSVTIVKEKILSWKQYGEFSLDDID